MVIARLIGAVPHKEISLPIAHLREAEARPNERPTLNPTLPEHHLNARRVSTVSKANVVDSDWKDDLATLEKW